MRSSLEDDLFVLVVLVLVAGVAVVIVMVIRALVAVGRCCVGDGSGGGGVVVMHHHTGSPTATGPVSRARAGQGRPRDTIAFQGCSHVPCCQGI